MALGVRGRLDLVALHGVVDGFEGLGGGGVVGAAGGDAHQVGEAAVVGGDLLFDCDFLSRPVIRGNQVDTAALCLPGVPGGDAGFVPGLPGTRVDERGSAEADAA